MDGFGVVQDGSPGLLTDWEESARLAMMLIKGEACIVAGKIVHEEEVGGNAS